MNQYKIGNMTTYPTLYKRTTSGKVQTWFMEIEDDRYRSTSGQLDGKRTTTEWTVAKAKNVGRANATTSKQQAVAEVEAEYEKKLARDYHKLLSDIDTHRRFKPMLATKWGDRASKVSGRVYIQPKLDGVRCIATKTGLWSREGKPILGAPHIIDYLRPFFERDTGLILDGELYNHALKDDFNKIVSCVKKQKPTLQDLVVSREHIQYWVYDIPSHDHPFDERVPHLKATLEGVDDRVVHVETVLIEVDKVDDHAALYIDQGFEGAMVRICDSLYENKRSNNLIKWKEFQDDEFTIIDIQEGDGNRAGMAARVVVGLPDGRNFSAGLIGNVDYCKQLLIDKNIHIGKMGTVVFQNYTPDGIPRFPKFKGVRWDT